MMVGWKADLGNTFQSPISKLLLSVSDMDFKALTGGLRVTYWIVSEQKCSTYFTLEVRPGLF